MGINKKQKSDNDTIICDTDAGSDVDDYLALAYLANAAPERFKLVSTTYGPVDLRARAVSTLFQSMDVNIPVVAGVKELMTPGKPIWLTGEEDYLVDQNAHVDDTDIIDAYLQYDNFVLLAIGPLTNVATLIQHPEFVKRCSRIVMMGGTIHGKILPVEHNFQCDPVATKIVIDSLIPKVLIPLELTAPMPMTEEHQLLFSKSTSEYGKLLWQWIANWRKVTNTFWTVTWPDRKEKTSFAPPFYDSVHWHDPIAAAYIFHPELFATDEAHVTVTSEGGLKFGKGGNAVTVCVGVEAEVMDIITETIINKSTKAEDDGLILAEEPSLSLPS